MPKRKVENVEPDDGERLEVLASLGGVTEHIPCSFGPDVAGVLANSIAVITSCGGYVSCWYDNSISIYSGTVRLGTSTARVRATEGPEFIGKLWKIAEKFRPMWDKLYPEEVWPGPTVEWLKD